MDVHDVIESYVRDVARLLPRDKRNDVAMELRALLHDELEAKAGMAGRPPDRRMAMELLAGFGRPAEVATRYQPRNSLIDPADNHNFAIWTVVGILALAVLGHDRSADAQFLGALHWVGIMFVVFALIGWGRRRQPEGRFSWRPRAQDMPAHGGRWPALASALGLCVFPLAMYLSPQGFWDAATLGKGVADGLGLTKEFLGSWQRIATIGWLLLVIASYLVVVVRNGWPRWNRRLSIVAHLGLGLMLLAHAAPLATPVGREPFAIFLAEGADAVARPWFGLAGAIILLATLYDLYQEWGRVEPAPAHAEVSAGATTAG
ncbi:hypothetical protein [Cognatiluteimonas lumbrici]|uniref:hypothetical protein n=1 Tax=Cognatiluteimonas lumbrici TaxID=2559601 RepID=UPI0011274476|nr:hypothetical protein [Luteimonas lumbrici]